MRKLCEVMVLVALAGGMALAEWSKENAAKFDTWKSLPAAERYTAAGGLLFNGIVNLNTGSPSVAECDAMMAVAQADADAGSGQAAASVQSVKNSRAFRMGLDAIGMLTKDPITVKPAEIALAQADAYGVKMKATYFTDIVDGEFYNAAWRLGLYTREERAAQYLKLCGQPGVGMADQLYAPTGMPMVLDDPALIRAGAAISARTHAKEADTLLKLGVIKKIVEANLLGELSNADAVAVLGVVAKGSWGSVQLDYPADEVCTPEQLAAKVSLQNAANKVASTREGILADM